ncbi:TIGR03087 family PEP-CTERM/XrtA system glycosyltransferase [Marinobacter changyiensis]|uniref:TIGR03087 family PEP-CTERM/XrtA system glycosyltransferase n=1 Tax=Marinobacter changyiensis TaxID=2604091 RepID=UPI001265A259|nr:TIGR03087 family PEP-CTERM/XrtA system glycosyltransferase [Marinobacter changyiensis]
MKILVLSHRIPFPADKGEKIRTFHQVQFLASRGHDVVVLSPYEDDGEQNFARDLAKHLTVKVLMFPLMAKWLRLIRGLAKKLPLSVACFYNHRLQTAFDKLVGSGECDVVICTSSAMAAYVFRNPKLADRSGSPKVRLIMDFMDLDSDKWRQYQKASSFLMSLVYGREAKLISRWEKHSYERFDDCFFISGCEVELFARQLPESRHLKIMGNGIDTDIFFPRRLEERPHWPVFLFTGVMNYKPNEEAVLWFVNSIWDRIKGQWPDAEFFVAGMDPGVRIQGLGRKPGITVTGFVQDIVPYYHNASVFIAPLRIARGVQNKILQALACGLPVITTRLGAEGIKARHREDILVADSDDDFFDAIKQVLEDKVLYERLAQNGPLLIHRDYNWGSMLEELNRAVEIRDRE